MTQVARRGLAALSLATAAVAVVLVSGAGCTQDCCVSDSAPIPLARAPLGGPAAGEGAMLTRARVADTTTPFLMAVDTASPLTVLTGAASSTTPGSRGFDLLDATWADATQPAPVRAKLRNIGVFSLPVGPAGDEATLPLGVLGGDVLRSFSVELRFGETCGDSTVDAGATAARCSAMTLWRHQGASLAFLGSAGYATLRFTLIGGGETTARAPADTFGIRAPVTLPATRVILRACAAPKTFSIDDPLATCCKRGDEVTPEHTSGLDLALVLATGTGPLVLSQSAWTRLQPKLPAAPVMTSGTLLIPSWPAPIAAMWSTIPRLALVDLESTPTSDPGPCVELSRARRIRWVTNQQSMNPDTAACVQPCDVDPTEPPLALNSAAYVEIGGALPVAVIADDEELLQSLRFDVRPLGPEIDGLLGAGALTPTRVELDYLTDPRRAIFSCELGTTEDVCFATARCPRLPDHSQKHTCFGLPEPIGLPSTCAPSGCQ
ncbi:MAG: hypothetical protein JWM82_381 [Myxococcales bacterium]|nr:hypothetical protein [Myxococcales bacterium]